MRAQNNIFRITCKDDHAEILLYDVVGADWFGGITAKQFADELKQAKNAKTIDLRINSPGGDVFDGFTMFTLLKSHKATINVFVDGLAASIASVIAMAGDSIEMATNAMMMIHDPWAVAVGNAAEFRKRADLLDKVGDSIVDTYASRSTSDADDIRQWMGDETWMNADEAVDRGFADRIGDEMAIAACIRPELMRFKNIPARLLNPTPEPPKPPTIEEIQRRIDAARNHGRQNHVAA